jgi:hypothetical protein
MKAISNLLTDTHKDYTWSQLRDTEIRRIQESPACVITKLRQLPFDLFSIVLEDGIKQAAHVLQHHRLRPTLVNQSNRLWEKISFVVRAELLARLGKRGAWNAAGNKINALIGRAGKPPHIPFDDVPLWPIESERCASRWLDLDQCDMIEPGPLKPVCLPAGSRADFERSKPHL